MPLNNQTQPNNQSGDQSAAALAFATQLSEQMMPQAEQGQDMFGGQGGGQANQASKTPNVGSKLEQMNAKFTEEIEELKKEVQKDDMTQEVADIRAELETLLKEDGQEEKN